MRESEEEKQNMIKMQRQQIAQLVSEFDNVRKELDQAACETADLASGFGKAHIVKLELLRSSLCHSLQEIRTHIVIDGQHNLGSAQSGLYTASAPSVNIGNAQNV
ncbi:hypothetical protein Tcan_10307 [Toxocara canis]|uniref:Uncharacterized protein n=1 Tax=Toxocara canis TaxID=6265 RepID=A0A0B2VTU1_TOXCA|nr:hypothetical protein Tcan_10307 [Toxocara canis]